MVESAISTARATSTGTLEEWRATQDLVERRFLAELDGRRDKALDGLNEWRRQALWEDKQHWGVVAATLTFGFEQAGAVLIRQAEQAAGAEPPVDLDGAADTLAEERAALLVTGANVIDQLMGLAKLGIGVQRELAGVEAAARMRLARVLPQPALDPPPPRDPYDGGEATEDFHALHTAPTVQLDTLGDEIRADAPDRPEWWPATVTRVGGWWRRLRDHSRHVWAEVTVGMATWAPWGVG